MDFLESLLGRNGFLPHGYCFTWAPSLLWSMVTADAVIAASYFSIPLALWSFMRQRRDDSLRGMAGLFSAFIFACGLTHVMGIWTIWLPDYGPQMLTKVVTAVVSLATAVALWRLIPHALKIPSVNQLQGVIQHLESEVAQRRSAEDHLAEVEQSLAVTLSSIGAGFLATDREGRVTRMNSVAEQVLGWPQEEARGRSYWEVFHREGRPDSYLQRNPVDLITELRMDVDMPQHLVCLGRDGRRSELEVRAASTLGVDGQIQGMAMVFRDITASMRAEAQAAHLAAIVESSSDAIISKTLDGRITSWNRAAVRLFGWSPDEAIGQPVQKVIPPGQVQEELDILGRIALGQAVPSFETWRQAIDGRPIPVSLSISPIRNARGQIIGASTVARDITAQRQAEAALRDSDERLRFTLESAQIGDWSLDLESGQSTRSLRHDRCFGHAQPVAQWDFGTFLAQVHPDDRAEVQRRFDASVAARGEWNIDCRVVWPDGSLHWLAVHGSVRHEDGQPPRMVGIVSDITHHRQAEETRLLAQRLQAENNQIQAANRLKTQFLANVSHELRTPLNAVIGFADLLHAGRVPADSPKHREYLGHIGTSGRHLLQLINDLLDLSKVESGKFEFFPEPVDLPRLVKEVCDVQHTALQRKQLRLAVTIDPALAGLVQDPVRLKQVLYNYLSNAIKYTPPGGSVSVQALPEGAARWRLEVADTGVGIAEADLPLLFSEFTRLEAGYSKQQAGTGLGLALTRRLVQAQGGNVGVRSSLGQGSVFHLVLDRVVGAAAPAAPSRVLLIESDDGQRERVALALTGAGFDVDAAGGGELALQQARQQIYGAIAMDLLFPGTGGLELLSRLRSEGQGGVAPVRGLSVSPDSGRSAWFPVADVMFKPMRADDVGAALARLGLPRPSRVMVVDDDPLALQLMQATLSALGFAAICLPGGREALAEIDRHRPDAMILDLMMPGMDGFDTLEILRQRPAWQALPVIIWSALHLSDEEAARLTQTARSLLLKGGGGLQGLLDNLRRWREAVPATVTPET